MAFPKIYTHLREEDGHGAWLIVERPTGVFYTNQTNGNGCNQDSAEGALIPLPRMQEVFYAVDGLYMGTWHEFLGEVISPDEFDEALRKVLKGDLTITVNRERMTESYEAWVHVNVEAGTWMRGWVEIEGARSFPAILTWENSD